MKSSRLSNGVYWFLKVIFYTFLKVFNRLEVIGSENVPEKGGVIVAANHVSYLDPPIIGVALRRQATYMAKQGLFKVPLLGTFVKLFSFPVNRDRPQLSTIREAINRLKNGGLIVLFPEGARSVDGSLLDAKRGIGMIAAMSRMPVVPALIEGTEKALPVGAKFLRPSKIKVIFGKPLKVEEKETGKYFQERICKEIMEAIKNLKVKVEAKVKKNSQPQP
ncbi:MAG: lysophospholipid acyltransferase family protein [Nitrospirota bacterium]